MSVERKAVSYQRNRDYSNHFIWIYECNWDLHNWCKRARCDHLKGYVNKLKYNGTKYIQNSYIST